MKKISIYFPNKIYGSNFIKQHSKTVMVRNCQNADCTFKNKFIVLFVIIFGTFSLPMWNVAASVASWRCRWWRCLLPSTTNVTSASFSQSAAAAGRQWQRMKLTDSSVQHLYRTTSGQSDKVRVSQSIDLSIDQSINQFIRQHSIELMTAHVYCDVDWTSRKVCTRSDDRRAVAKFS